LFSRAEFAKEDGANRVLCEPASVIEISLAVALVRGCDRWRVLQVGADRSCTVQVGEREHLDDRGPSGIRRCSGLDLSLATGETVATLVAEFVVGGGCRCREDEF
jgi:hypothetical protein